MVNNQELITFQECCKWSAQNPGKTPDPWYKLKFRPKPVKPKPVKEKKEKKEKELTKKQKEKLEKVKVLLSFILQFYKHLGYQNSHKDYNSNTNFDFFSSV